LIEGVADLPLHWGHVPPWLIRIMRRLAKAIVELILIEYGSEGLLKRLSDPLWFQAFNNVIGMDWDSSGSTTVTTAIVRDVLNELGAEVRVAGGKGKASRRTLNDIESYAEVLGISESRVNLLKEASIISAKVDTSLLQDGFNLYHHTLVFDRDGRWVVIQQGMNTELRFARRYHIAWYSVRDLSYLTNPHAGVASDIKTKPLNLTHRNSLSSAKVVIDLVNEGPKKIRDYLVRVNALLKGLRTLTDLRPPREIDRSIPYYRPVKLTSRLLNLLKQAYEVKPRDMREVMVFTGLGPECIRALSLISELIYREPPSLNDVNSVPFSPFKYAFTIGGKDGIPYPVKREVAEAVIRELRSIIENAKLGDKERLVAFRALRKLAPKDYIPV